MSQTYPSAEDNVRMERHQVVRSAATILFEREYPGIPREEVRAHVVQLLLDSVNKQARWSKGLEQVS